MLVILTCSGQRAVDPSANFSPPAVGATLVSLLRLVGERLPVELLGAFERVLWSASVVEKLLLAVRRASPKRLYTLKT
jgi:hypothetical protein